MGRGGDGIRDGDIVGMGAPEERGWNLSKLEERDLKSWVGGFTTGLRSSRAGSVPVGKKLAFLEQDRAKTRR